MKIGNFDFNSNSTLIIAEVSANHNHDINIMRDTLIAIKESGADCVKIQTYTPDTITIDCDKEDFIIKNSSLWNDQKLYDLYREAYTPWEWHKEIFKLAANLELICFSSPFDFTSVDFLESFDVPAYKIASFEITDINLIKYVASKKKPIIISTGIAEKKDIELAIQSCRSVGNNDIILLKCTSSYPSSLEDANLRMIDQYHNDFNLITGLSDHTLGDICPIVAVSLGARVIEKHFILNKNLESPDSKFSLDKIEFKRMVNKIRDVEKSLGNIDYSLKENQQKSRQFSRSLYIVKDIKKGEKFNDKNVRSIRPGFGLHPKFLKQILGKESNVDLEKGTRFDLKFIKTNK